MIFAVAAAERPPEELLGRADEVSILFPWGSLLRGALGLDPEAAAGIAALVASGGVVRALVSVEERDASAQGIGRLVEADAGEIARRWSAFGVDLAELRPASREEIAASGSTWAKRLRADGRGTDRAVWRIDLLCGGMLERTD